METKLLIMPGLGDSGERHWQSFWLKKFKQAVKLNQDNWEEPKLTHWLTNLNEVIITVRCPLILVAHSLAVSLVAHWASLHTNINVAGALLVAPADVDSPAHTPDVVRNFAPMPLQKFSFSSIVVASEDDPFVDFSRAQYFARQWGSHFAGVGNKGHINSDSNLQCWEEGQLLLQNLYNATTTV